MTAMKNAAHLAVLAIWVVLGVLFSLKTLFLPALLPVVLFWAWFAGYAAFTSFLSNQFKGPLAAVGVHGATLLALQLVPKVMPFGIVRVGLDLLF
ncbi:MAG: hypothetical protein Q8N23_01060 [Archangium sp.]|nr:hypothetical protein [Archangium sp.]MDP3151225.1 hypothetical protein [Archangium sp.]